MDELNFCSGNIEGTGCRRNDDRKIKDECIIAFKVYDSCRQQDCLDNSKIGPARAAGTGSGTGCCSFTPGEIIVPPSNAAAVTISNLRVEDVIVVSKVPNNFRPGFWDIDLKYVFRYTLTFRNINGEGFCTVPAQSVFNKTVTLFGSVATDTMIATDLFNSHDGGEARTLCGSPFVLVESKAVALRAELGFDRCCCDDNDADFVNITIGLFTIIKLYRIVNLLVESRGFCIPERCNDISSTNPCDFFENLDFPLDIFAPPQKKEFFEGISSNIPADRDRDRDCDCDCGCGCDRDRDRNRCDRDCDRDCDRNRCDRDCDRDRDRNRCDRDHDRDHDRDRDRDRDCDCGCDRDCDRNRNRCGCINTGNNRIGFGNTGNGFCCR